LKFLICFHSKWPSDHIKWGAREPTAFPFRGCPLPLIQCSPCFLVFYLCCRFLLPLWSADRARVAGRKCVSYNYNSNRVARSTKCTQLTSSNTRVCVYEKRSKERKPKNEQKQIQDGFSLCIHLPCTVLLFPESTKVYCCGNVIIDFNIWLK